jgi:hypothetical protein
MRNFGRPWWQVTRTARQAYALGSLYLLLGIGQLALLPGDGLIGNWSHLATCLCLVLLAVATLTSGVMLRRRGSVAGESPTFSLNPAGRTEVDSLLARGKVIPAVRRVRELTGLPLADAKRLVDSLRR